MSFNSDGNLMGRIVALGLIVGVVVGVRGLMGPACCASCDHESAVSAPASPDVPAAAPADADKP